MIQSYLRCEDNRGQNKELREEIATGRFQGRSLYRNGVLDYRFLPLGTYR